MSKLVFYRQQRVDGGIRSGVDLDDDSLFELFEPGQEDDDPTLKWFVDVRWRGAKLPRPEKAQDWLLRQESAIRPALTEAAEELRSGIDLSDPVQRELLQRNSGSRARLVVHAARRVAAREIAKQVRYVANHWSALIGALQPCEAVT